MTQLYTRCPSCKTTYGISLDAIKIGRGQALCQKCQKPFSTLESLAASAPATKQPTPGYNLVLLANPVQENNEKLSFTDWGSATKPGQGKKNRAIWSIVLFAALVLLCSQVWTQQRDQLLLHESVYSIAQQICNISGCTLQPYHNADQFKILNRALTSQNDRQATFSIVFSNTADLTQRAPQIQLTLLALTGDKVAQRVFSPSDYLSQTNGEHLLQPQQVLELEFDLDKSDLEFSGYEIRFL